MGHAKYVNPLGVRLDIAVSFVCIPPSCALTAFAIIWIYALIHWPLSLSPSMIEIFGTGLPELCQKIDFSKGIICVYLTENPSGKPKVGFIDLFNGH